MSYSAEVLRQQSLRPQMLFAMGESRPPKELLQSFVGLVEDISFVDLPGGRPQIEPAECLRVWSALGGKGGQVLSDISKIESWIESESSQVKLITGSFYLVGEAYRLLGFHPDELLPGKI